MLISVVLSLLIANTSLASSFSNFLETTLGFETQTIHLQYSLLTWINDGLMAIFFLLVGLEIKREIVEGELSDIKHATLPVLAALGGVLVPASIYAVFNHDNAQTAGGWGIPMATDIAFAIAILSLLGNRVSTGLKVFLAALAIVDDLMAILVIALFYSTELHVQYMGYAALMFLIQLALNKCKVKAIVWYLIPGVFMWYFIHHSGIHATIAGVLTALTLPTTPDDSESPLEKLEHALSRPVNLVIMPLFALANTNITFESEMLQGLGGSLGLGIVFGLLLGKPVGIVLMSWISVRLKWAKLPDGAVWTQLIGLGFLGGIGFTMSIFITLLSLDEALLQADAKFAILCASVIAGVTGYLTLRNFAKRKQT